MDLGKIARLEPVDVPQNFMLGVIPVEHFVGQILAGPGKGRRKTGLDSPRELFKRKRRRTACEYLEQRLDVTSRRHLVQGDSDGAVLEAPKIDAALFCAGHHFFGSA